MLALLASPHSLSTQEVVEGLTMRAQTLSLIGNGETSWYSKLDLTGNIGVLSVWCTRFSHALRMSLTTSAKSPFFIHFGAAREGTVQLSVANAQDSLQAATRWMA